MVNFDMKTGTDVNTGKEKPVLLLSLRNAEDRRLIRQYLAGEFEIAVSENGLDSQNFDLCILDEQTWVANREALRTRKRCRHRFCCL